MIRIICTTLIVLAVLFVLATLAFICARLMDIEVYLSILAGVVKPEELEEEDIQPWRKRQN